jgi:molybdate-binding protein/DNA-binding XRE family transcriptional regulator
MKSGGEKIICRLKEIRQSKGWSQTELANRVGVKRQAIYDMESGKYVPNTALALRLARQLASRVEDLFYEEIPDTDKPVTLVEPPEQDDSRIEVANVRGRLVGYPLAGKRTFNHGFRPADGLLNAGGDKVKLLYPQETIDQTIVLLGCDPAFSILRAHVLRYAPTVRMHYRFTSSYNALEGLAAGHAHIAGTHLHNTSSSSGEANVTLARNFLEGTRAKVIAFSLLEEGFMVAPGNPLGIRDVSDLAGGRVRLVNRESGAALRTLLDDYLKRLDIGPENIAGYESVVRTHTDGAQKVAFGFADAALGFRAVASAYGLDFVPIQVARCDLVVPEDMAGQPAMRILLDTLQSGELRKELRALPGYESSSTGSVIAEL